MSEKDKKLELLKSQYVRGFLSTDEYEKEKMKVLGEVDWGALFNIKKISLAAAVLLICGIGFYISASVGSEFFVRSERPHNIKQENLDDLLSEMCDCYDNAVVNSPSQEPNCARLRAKIYRRIAIDSLEAQRFDSLIAYCPNYPVCTNLQQELNKSKNDSITAYYRRKEAENWQFLRTTSDRYRDIKEADENYENVKTQIQNIERRIRINCSNY